mmetsp:Transcript_75605/g.163587  ORF Transcript_75605/g.163587 Transcript_75605/m.163587 type:complete len:226 (+) Transcript_75605:1537-2214(+)
MASMIWRANVTGVPASSSASESWCRALPGVSCLSGKGRRRQSLLSYISVMSARPRTPEWVQSATSKSHCTSCRMLGYRRRFAHRAALICAAAAGVGMWPMSCARSSSPKWTHSSMYMRLGRRSPTSSRACTARRDTACRRPSGRCVPPLRFRSLSAKAYQWRPRLAAEIGTSSAPPHLRNSSRITRIRCTATGWSPVAVGVAGCRVGTGPWHHVPMACAGGMALA